jgi:translation initiation factor IF-3
MILNQISNLVKFSTQPAFKPQPRASNLVRFIDSSGKSQGFVPKESIVIPPDYDLIQVAPSVFKLIYLLAKKAPDKPDAEEGKKPMSKTIQVRPAISENDLERKLQIMRGWLSENPRVSSVTLSVRKESGIKSHLRGVTADQLVSQICNRLEESDKNIRAGTIKREGMEISCAFTYLHNKKVSTLSQNKKPDGE